MATYTKRKSSWYAQVRRKGHKTIGRSFDTKADAEKWALSLESKMGVGIYQDNRETLSTSLNECLDRYAAEIIPHKKGAKRELSRVALWRKSDLAEKSIGTIKQTDVAAWRDARIASGISGTTVKLDLALISHLFTIAIKEWGYPLTNPVLLIRKPKSNKARDRRFRLGEEQKILDASTDEQRAFVVLAVETGMRRSELVYLQRSWIRGRVAFLPETKNGTARSVPLSRLALQTIEELPSLDTDRLFSYEPDAYTRGFNKACKASIPSPVIMLFQREFCRVLRPEKLYHQLKIHSTLCRVN